MSYKEMYEQYVKWVEDLSCKNMFIILTDRLREIEERLDELEAKE